MLCLVSQGFVPSGRGRRQTPPHMDQLNERGKGNQLGVLRPRKALPSSAAGSREDMLQQSPGEWATDEGPWAGREGEDVP